MDRTRSLTEISVRTKTLAGAGAILACIAATPPADGASLRAASASSVRFSVVTTGSIADQGRGGAARGRLVRSSAQAARILRAWDLERAIPAAKAVDYARRSVVIVLAGSVPDTAYRLAVQRVSVRSRRVDVRAAVRRPAEAMGGMAISRPYSLVSVDRDDVARARAIASVHVTGR